MYIRSKNKNLRSLFGLHNETVLWLSICAHLEHGQQIAVAQLTCPLAKSGATFFFVAKLLGNQLPLISQLVLLLFQSLDVTQNIHLFFVRLEQRSRGRGHAYLPINTINHGLKCLFCVGSRRSRTNK